MKKKVRLVVLNPYNSLQSYEHRPMQEAKYFYEKGCDVEVYIFQRNVLGHGIKESVIQNIPVKHFLCKTERIAKLFASNFLVRLLKPFVHFWWFAKFILFLKKEIRLERDACFVAHNLEMALASCLAKGKSKTSITFVMREFYEGQVKNPVKSFFVKTLSRWIQDQCEYLIQVVPEQKRETLKRNQHKILYIPNYPKASNYENICFTESDKLRVNYIGCVRDKKSLMMLMDAARDIPEIEIGIHGMGDAYSSLKSLEKQYSNVHITGYYDYEKDTRMLFANTDIVYCAYNIEIPNWRVAYPIKLYEAIQVGVPVILCKGMAPEQFVIDNKCGFVFSYSKDDLKRLLLELVENADKVQMVKQQMQRLKGCYTWDKIVQKYDILIEN